MGLFSKKEEIEILPVSTTNEIAGRETIEYKGLVKIINKNNLFADKIEKVLSEEANKLGANAVVGLLQLNGIFIATAVVIADKK